MNEKKETVRTSRVISQSKRCKSKDTMHCYFAVSNFKTNNSSAVAEMGDRGHNRHGPKRGRGCCAPFVESRNPV